MYAKFGFYSSSRFAFRVRTYRHTVTTNHFPSFPRARVNKPRHVFWSYSRQIKLVVVHLLFVLAMTHSTSGSVNTPQRFFLVLLTFSGLTQKRFV